MFGSALARAWIVSALATASVACSASPDVVASGTTKDTVADASPYLSPIEVVSGCSAGEYKGSFFSEHADGGPNLQVDGDFTFTLEAVGKEFLQLKDNAPLHGNTTMSFTFDATISGGHDCVEGEFQTTLDGTFSIMQGTPIPFDGKIHGQYVPPAAPAGGGLSAAPGFIGTWEIFLKSTHGRIAGGLWSAVQTDPMR